MVNVKLNVLKLNVCYTGIHVFRSIRLTVDIQCLSNPYRFLNGRIEGHTVQSSAKPRLNVAMATNAKSSIEKESPLQASVNSEIHYQSLEIHQMDLVSMTFEAPRTGGSA